MKNVIEINIKRGDIIQIDDNSDRSELVGDIAFRFNATIYVQRFRTSQAMKKAIPRILVESTVNDTFDENDNGGEYAVFAASLSCPKTFDDEFEADYLKICPSQSSVTIRHLNSEIQIPSPRCTVPQAVLENSGHITPGTQFYCSLRPPALLHQILVAVRPMFLDSKQIEILQ